MKKQTIGLVVALVIIACAIGFLEKGKVGPGALTGPAQDVALPDSAMATTSMAMASSTTASTSAASMTAEQIAAATQARIAEKSKLYDRAKEITDPTGFVNTGGQPITLSQYVGKKVILLDIMTYSCINCIRTFPYLNSWYTKYEDKGLIIIGIHTPEFDFEKNIDNVKAAMAKYGIQFPVVLDNDYGTWNAYNNQYWPMKYLIDIDGFVRYTHIGEGGYDETEQEIQGLLKERDQVLGISDNVDLPLTTGATEQGAITESQETYFGSARNEFFGNGTVGESGTANYTVPAQVSPDHFYLSGTWNILPDHAENTSVPASIVYNFSAKHVYFVASAVNPVKVQVLVDGKPLGANAGADVTEANGVDTVTIQGSRLYDIYAGDSFGTHTIQLMPQGAGLQAFTFTFGD